MKHKAYVLLSVIVISCSVRASESSDEEYSFSNNTINELRKITGSFDSGRELSRDDCPRKESGGSENGLVKDPVFEGWDEEDLSGQEVQLRRVQSGHLSPRPQKNHSGFKKYWAKLINKK